MNPLAAIAIICGPGLSGCGNKPLPPALAPWSLTAPGVATSSDGRITISYDPDRDVYLVAGTGWKHTASDLDSAMYDADKTRDSMTRMGMQP